MLAEIIAIGTEITSGAKLDTNSQWLSLQLADLGIPVRYHTTVADDLESNVEVLRIASGRVDLVLITGGLGPTLDDLTRDALARLAHVELVLHQASLDHVQRFFRSRGREMPARNRVQALFPLGAEPLENPIGTAPGIWMELPRAGRSACCLAALPGVPSEMKKMFHEQVRPRLPGGQMVIRRARINCFGLGESHTEELLGDLTARGHDPEIGITAHDATITLRIIAQGPDEQACQAKIADAAQQIRERLGDYVFGVEDEELQHVVVRELKARGLTFTTIESGTCGLLAEWIAHVAESGDSYAGGTVLSDLGDIRELMDELSEHPVDADYVLLVGNETTTADDRGQVTSTIPLGLVGPEGLSAYHALTWSGNPAITRSRAAKSALDLLRRTLAES